MRTEQLIQAAKERTGTSTNYALAKIIGVAENRLFDYEKGKVLPDAYALTRLALVLELDPIAVIAEVGEETEKNETKREFWRNFRMRAAALAALLVGLQSGLPSVNEASAMPSARTEQTERQIMRTIRRKFRQLIRWTVSPEHAPGCGAIPSRRTGPADRRNRQRQAIAI